MMTFDQALLFLYPNIARTVENKAFDADGNEVAYDKSAVDAYVDGHAYIGKRAKEYPPYTDYIDGVVKGDQTQIDAYIAACLAVKTKFPKV